MNSTFFSTRITTRIAWQAARMRIVTFLWPYIRNVLQGNSNLVQTVARKLATVTSEVEIITGKVETVTGQLA